MLEDEGMYNMCWDCFGMLRFTYDEDTDLAMCTVCQRHVPITDSCPEWKKRHEQISQEFKEREPWKHCWQQS